MPHALTHSQLFADIRIQGSSLEFHFAVKSLTGDRLPRSQVSSEVTYRLDVNRPAEVLEALRCWLLAIETKVAHCAFEFDVLQGGQCHVAWTRTKGKNGHFSFEPHYQQPTLGIEVPMQNLVAVFTATLTKLKVDQAMQMLGP